MFIAAVKPSAQRIGTCTGYPSYKRFRETDVKITLTMMVNVVQLFSNTFALSSLILNLRGRFFLPSVLLAVLRKKGRRSRLEGAEDFTRGDLGRLPFTSSISGWKF